MPQLMEPTDLPFVMMEARERPMHVSGLQLFTTPDDAGPDYLRSIYESTISDSSELHPLLSRRPGTTPVLGRLQWEEEDRRIDLGYHVRHTGLARPGRFQELLEVVSRLHGTLLDRNRPLWEAHLIEGLDDGRFAVYTKIHHALLDGVSAMRLLQDALSTDADERDMPPPWAARTRIRAGRPEPANGRSDASRAELLAAGLLGGAANLARFGYDAVAVGSRMTDLVRDGLTRHATVLPYQAPESMFNVPITGARRFAAGSWELERVRAAGKRLGGTLNDAVLAMCGGAFRRYLLDHDALPDTPLVAMVPVSLRPADDAAVGGTSVGVILANLATHTDSPAERFEVVKTSMDAGKTRLDGLSPGQAMVMSSLAFVPMATAPLFRLDGFRKPPYNVTISNIPGPRETVYWNGARMDSTYPVSIPLDGQALNVTLSSYDGSLDFGLVADRDRVPEVQHLLDHLEASLAELEDV